MSTHKGKSFFEVKNLKHSYLMGDSEVNVIDDISFHIKENEFVSILGPSGCGKTTLLNLLGGLEKPKSGSIIVGDIDISKISNHEICKYRKNVVAFIFQFYNIFPHLTAIENIKLAIGILPIDRKEVDARAHEYLDKVGLSKKKDSFPAHLSGGEQQRVAIARALAKKSKLILADEPTGNLDQHTGKEIIDLFQSIHQSTPATIIIITHDKSIADRADRIMTLCDGKIV